MRTIAVLSLVLVLALLAGCAPASGGQSSTTPAATTAPANTTAAPTTAPTAAATEAPTAEATATTEVSASPEATGASAATEQPTTEATATGGPSGGGAVPDNALVSVPAADAPALDGAADDAAWADAPALEIKTAGGANKSDTTVTIKSVHTDDMVYFLLTWADPTQSFLRLPWEKQADGSWKYVTDPNDKGGDNNTTYEDKISLIWNINDSIQGFDQSGCFTLCHAGENSDVKPYGNKYTAGEGQIGDIWHWKSVRNVNQVDDQYVDHTKYSKDTPEAGRKSDAKTGSGGYVNNETQDKKLPAFMPPNGGAKDGSPGYILDSEKVAFDDALFKAGDRVPGIVKSELEGDRGDLGAGWKYASGTWTLEIGRKLTTGSKTDVQFDDLAKTYHFGLATFDNAQVRHAFQAGATPFVFQQ